MKFNFKNILQTSVLAFILMNVLLIFTEDLSRTVMIHIKPFLISIQAKEGIFIQEDENNVPIVDYGYMNGKYIGPQFNPMTVSQRVFKHNKQFLQGDSTAFQKMQNNADWLLQNATMVDSAAFLECHFPWETHNMTAPWRSGMSQGQALRALMQVYDITGDRELLRFGKQLLNAFFIEVKDGGVTYKDDDGGWWYEECADENGIESRILNGMMFALRGIAEYYKRTDDADALFLFAKGMISLKKNLGTYDNYGYSYYDISGKKAGWHYHRVHIELLDELYQVDPAPILKEYSERWAAFLKKPFLLRAFIHPSKMAVGTLLLNFTAALFLVLTMQYFRAGKVKTSKTV